MMFPDKDPEKPSITLVQPDFIVALARHMQNGIKNKRKRDDWKELEWNAETRRQYCDALLRHALINFDPIAVAANCMIIWYNDRKTTPRP